MKSTAPTKTAEGGVSTLARVLGNEEGKFPLALARYILKLGFSERDKVRMHDLALRNQEGTPTASEREELFAFAKAGTLVSILKSKVRPVVKVKAAKRATS